MLTPHFLTGIQEDGQTKMANVWEFTVDLAFRKTHRTDTV